MYHIKEYFRLRKGAQPRLNLQQRELHRKVCCGTREGRSIRAARRFAGRGHMQAGRCGRTARVPDPPFKPFCFPGGRESAEAEKNV